MNKKPKKRSIIWITIQEWIKNKIPIISCALFLLISFIPIGMSYINKLPLIILPMFYWITKRPNNMDFTYVLILAFIYDILENNFFGINMLLIILMYFCMIYQQFIIMKTFAISYWIFAVILSAYYILKTGLFVYIFNARMALSEIFISYIITFAIYPMVYFLCRKIERKLLI
jgi:rod shape-determining protein MreD